MIKKIKNIIFISILCLITLNSSYAARIQETEISILNEVNSHRQKHHLPPLKMDSDISYEAKTHSQRIANHSIPLGHKNFSQRARTLFNKFKHSRGIAENVAYAYSGSKDVVKQWLGSSGHRKNIEGQYQLTGIGIALDKEERIYITQIFLRVTN